MTMQLSNRGQRMCVWPLSLPNFAGATDNSLSVPGETFLTSRSGMGKVPRL